MPGRYLRTSDLARAAGVHPNTVRLYVDWGLVPPVERSPSGYRLFTQQHLDCLRLARTTFAAEYPGRNLRASSREVIEAAVEDNWTAAMARARAHSTAVQRELAEAERAADLLENWAQREVAETGAHPLSLSDVAKLLGVSKDVIRNWERDGLISPLRNERNNYRLFGEREIERLRIIRMLSRAGYSHMAILRMFLELDAGRAHDLKTLLDTPRPDEDIFTVADHWLTTLRGQEENAQRVIRLIEEVLERQPSTCPP
jgi:DNA-binding transcriptional MerR regulator